MSARAYKQDRLFEQPAMALFAAVKPDRVAVEFAARCACVRAIGKASGIGLIRQTSRMCPPGTGHWTHGMRS